MAAAPGRPCILPTGSSIRSSVRVDTFCYSSCANYVFLAGRNKLLAADASIMWHGGVMQPVERGDLEHLLDDMLGALEPEEARDAVLAERSRERLLEQMEASRLELIARETQFFQRIGVDQRITALGHLFECELLARDHDYDGWDLSLEDMDKLGVHGIEVIGDAAWEPSPAREDLQVFRIRLEQLPGFVPVTLALQHIQPGAHPYEPLLDGYCYLRFERARPIARFPRIRMIELPTSRIDLLTEIARTTHQAHGNQRQAQVGSGSHRVAGQNPEAPGIGRNLVAKRDLHREIRHARLVGELIDHRRTLSVQAPSTCGQTLRLHP